MPTMIHALATGFLLGGSLIIAIGAQNAFVLRQGLLRQHVLPLVAICAGADALLIAVGVAGVGTMLKQVPVLITAVTVLGAAFLAVYSLVAFRRAAKPAAMTVASGGGMSLRAAVATCLAFTFLNPHVYLDTVLLVGSLSTQFDGRDRVAYGVGAMLASVVWFTALGYGARLLQPLFARPIAWRILDVGIGIVMAALSASLVASLF